MAIGLFTVLKSVPWTTVISNAPVVADGAKKLWNAVASRRAPAQTDEISDPVHQPAAGNEAGPLEARLAEVRQAADRLEQQMLASSELINALAEQNAQLIELVETNRVRTLWLTRWTILAAAVAAVALGVAIFALARA